MITFAKISSGQQTQSTKDYFLNDSTSFRQIYIDGKLAADYFIDISQPNSDFHPILQKRVYYKETGSLEIIGNYNLYGEKSGTWYYYFPNGNIRSKVDYDSDYIIGAIIYYFENGEIRSEGRCDTFRIKDHVFNFYVGTWKSFYETGQIEQTGNYSPYVFSDTTDMQSLIMEIAVYNEVAGIASDPIKIRDGTWYRYDESGLLVNSIRYLNGRAIE